MTTGSGRPLTQSLVASSLDGFIDEDDNLDWLLSMPGGHDEANPYPAFVERVGALAGGAPLLPRRRTRPMRLLSATPSPTNTFVQLHYTLRGPARVTVRRSMSDGSARHE